MAKVQVERYKQCLVCDCQRLQLATAMVHLCHQHLLLTHNASVCRPVNLLCALLISLKQPMPVNTCSFLSICGTFLEDVAEKSSKAPHLLIRLWHPSNATIDVASRQLKGCAGVVPPW